MQETLRGIGANGLAEQLEGIAQGVRDLGLREKLLMLAGNPELVQDVQQQRFLASVGRVGALVCNAEDVEKYREYVEGGARVGLSEEAVWTKVSGSPVPVETYSEERGVDGLDHSRWVADFAAAAVGAEARFLATQNEQALIDSLKLREDAIQLLLKVTPGTTEIKYPLDHSSFTTFAIAGGSNNGPAIFLDGVTELSERARDALLHHVDVIATALRERSTNALSLIDVDTFIEHVGRWRCGYILDNLERITGSDPGIDAARQQVSDAIETPNSPPPRQGSFGKILGRRA